MGLSVTISRTLLGLQPLQLEDPNAGLTVVRIGPGSRTMQLEHATSPVSNGRVLTAARADIQEARLVIRAWSTNPATLLGLLETVEEALNQWSYTITLTIDGHTEVWVCQPANHSRGVSGEYRADALKGGWQDLTAQIPRQPVAYAFGN